MSDSIQAESAGKPGFTRRRFIIGTVGAGAVTALAGTTVRPPRALAATAPGGPPTTTLPLPTTTAPEQLLLTWGNNPAHDVTVSWSAPGAVPQPAPTLAISTKPITKHNPGTLIKLPEPAPLDVAKRYKDASSVSFTDGLNGQTTYFYHVQLTGPGAAGARSTTTRSATGQTRRPPRAPRSRPRRGAAPSSGSPATATWPLPPGT